MVEPLHLARAPISEAVLEIRVRRADSFSHEELDLFTAAIADQYPQKLTRKEFVAQIALGEAPAAQVGRQGAGYQLRSSDGTQVVQVHAGGFSFSRLRPYTEWESVQAEARRLWDIYVGIVKPDAVTRIGLRYINRIEIPLPSADFKEYLLTGPEIAPSLPQALRHYFMHLMIPLPERETLVIVNQTIDQSGTADDTLPLIFDIDASQTRQLAPEGDALWAAFESLRTVKNEFFFKSITAKTVELCS